MFITGLFHGVRHFAASVFHSAARWMEEWPRDILSAQCCHASFFFSDLPRVIQDFEKWEMCFADVGDGLHVVSECRMLGKVCGRMEVFFFLLSVQAESKSTALWWL